MQCPICKHDFPEPREGEKSYFPFCSDRCKLIDLGRWLGGKYQIPVSTDERDDVAVDTRPGLSADDDAA